MVFISYTIITEPIPVTAVICFVYFLQRAPYGNTHNQLLKNSAKPALQKLVPFKANVFQVCYARFQRNNFPHPGLGPQIAPLLMEGQRFSGQQERNQLH
ncbi:hypothetical protein CEXT_152121 [Caerostris extrusa]|uniref:Secreted protein n=1 Tax=Caerostris extrusa TaxID=172846 RepID=A0AAV4VH77_CAEEX|nr:hypothetical protein CEXT_152121 [Caerostris extrusa]